jgi:hypothetical protein
MAMHNKHYLSPVARAVPADDQDGNPSDVQTELDNIYNVIGAIATTTVAFGRAGAIADGSYLNHTGVPSSSTGFPVGGTDPKILNVKIRQNYLLRDFYIELEEHDGTTYTSIYTSPNLIGIRALDITGLSITLTPGLEIAAKLHKVGVGANPNDVKVVLDYYSLS